MAEQTMDLDIKDAILTRRFDLKDGGHVDLYVWQPTPVPPGDHYACAFLISGLGSAKIRRGYGIDSIQAMMLTLLRAGLDLYHSDAYKNQELTYLGSRNFDLPLLPGAKVGSSEYRQADLLTSAGSLTVVVMPDQKFPYIAYPGERLKTLIEWLSELAAGLKTSNVKTRKSVARTITGLTNEQKYYEAVCKRAGLHPSYIVAEADKPDDES